MSGEIRVVSCKGYEQALEICISLFFYISRDTQKEEIFRKKKLVKPPSFAVLKKINLLLIPFNLIVLERRNDPDLSGEPGGRAAQPILNSPHCAPHPCAAYLGWPAALGQALGDSLPTAYRAREDKDPGLLRFGVQSSSIKLESPQLNKSTCSQPSPGSRK